MLTQNELWCAIYSHMVVYRKPKRKLEKCDFKWGYLVTQMKYWPKRLRRSNSVWRDSAGLNMLISFECESCALITGV